jgi:hypothetical protein
VSAQHAVETLFAAALNPGGARGSSPSHQPPGVNPAAGVCQPQELPPGPLHVFDRPALNSHLAWIGPSHENVVSSGGYKWEFVSHRGKGVTSPAVGWLLPQPGALVWPDSWPLVCTHALPRLPCGSPVAPNNTFTRMVARAQNSQHGSFIPGETHPAACQQRCCKGAQKVRSSQAPAHAHSARGTHASHPPPPQPVRHD